MANKQPLGSDFDDGRYWTLEPMLPRVDTGEMWTRMADERWRDQLVRALVAQQWAVAITLCDEGGGWIGDDGGMDLCGPQVPEVMAIAALPSPAEMAAMILGET